MDLTGLGVLALFVVLMLFFMSIRKRWPAVFRPIKAYQELNTAVERAVEAGERVHLSLGTGSVIGSDSAAAFAGLSLLSQIAEATTTSDKPIVATAGDGAMAMLAQETLRSAYTQANAREQFKTISGRMLGPTPYSYTAELPNLLDNEDVSVHVLAGSFGSEGALAADFGRRQGAFVLAGTEDVQSQALLYATADHPLVGEELFAAGAYMGVGSLHEASVRTQDAVRLLIILAILIGTVLKTIGAIP
ncbi:MAG: hypothetical protein JXA97_06830 [Anaerolineales bacterium]|nr:hypothetical protein [Anaerolineales bacterium]